MAFYHKAGVCEAEFNELAQTLTHTILTNDDPTAAFNHVMMQLKNCIKERKNATIRYTGCDPVC